MSDTNRQSNVTSLKDDAAAKKLAREWGWSSPPKEIIATANLSVDAQRTQSADLLVKWGYIDEATASKLLKKKPASIQTLEFFGAEEPTRVLPYVEKVLALKNGRPFYESLTLLGNHPSMGDRSVISRCDELDAAMMMIEDTEPVLVFASFHAAIKFSTLGREARMTDPLLLANGGEMPRLAVGARDEISTILKMFHKNDGGGMQEETSAVWNAASAETVNKPEYREVARLIDHALNQNATDISLKPFRNGSYQILMRKWGDLIPPKAVATQMNPDLAAKALSLLMTKSGANPDSIVVRHPTDGQITYRSAVGDAFMRASFIPLNHLGELKNLTSVSLRLFPRTETSISLEDLHLQEEVARQIADAIRMPQGLILLAGPMNSGKSSTIAGAIGKHVEVFGDRKKRISVEDPVERHLYGITQINVPTMLKDKDGRQLTDRERFNMILKGLKRHDMNVLWVGEIRDRDSAEFCVTFAGSGHLVTSTIHAKDSVLAYDILSKMVSEDVRFQLAESMGLVVSQRLVKTVCPHCHGRHAPTENDRHLFKLNLTMLGEEAELPEEISFARPNSESKCKHCDDGYAGHLPINEVLPFTRHVKDLCIELLNGKSVRNEIAKARTVTLLQSGMAYLRAGLVDLESILFF